MRTKTLLCAAFVAAGALVAVAQNNVYSLNIVGYANVTAPAGYSILVNPLSTGVSNGANEVLTRIIDGNTVLTYDDQGYHYFGYDGGWVDETGGPTQPPRLAPGTGFFYFNSLATAETITFVGQVVPNPGATNSFSIPAGYSLIGSPMPVGGTLPAVANNMGVPVTQGAINLPVWDGATLLPFINESYVYKGFDGGWVDETGGPTSAPTLGIGQGFFFFNPEVGSVNWLQALPPQP